MFTWNFQYISKARLAESFHQLMLDSKKGDILIRIHTAIHLEDENGIINIFNLCLLKKKLLNREK